MIKMILIAFALLASLSLCDSANNYTLTISCGKCTTATGVNCLSFNGGPFSTLQGSIDKLAPNCPAFQTQLKIILPLSIVFSCNTACSGACGVSIVSGATQTICESTNKEAFELVTTTLNLLYSFV